MSLVSLIGVNRFDVRTDGNRLTAISLFERDLKSLSNGDEFAPEIFINNNKRINSVYGSVSLGYQKTYFLDVTARNDWASTLPTSNNSYFYPSVGGTILFSEFIPRNNILTFGKIRTSFAQVGNDTGFNQIRNSYVQGGNYNDTDWVALERIRKNLELKPELTSSTEFGIEAKLFNNRISFDGTYYKSSTNNQIINVSTTPTSGFVGKFLNAGEIRNEGMYFYLLILF